MFLTLAQMSSWVRAFLNWSKEVMTCSLNVPYLGADVIMGEGLLELVEGGDEDALHARLQRRTPVVCALGRTHLV
jgi:hypothetical protein